MAYTKIALELVVHWEAVYMYMNPSLTSFSWDGVCKKKNRQFPLEPESTAVVLCVNIICNSKQGEFYGNVNCLK